VTLTLLAILGAVVAVDATSLGQLMLSRPLVAGTLAGALVGMPLEGALIGALMEILSLAVLPVGASRYPETGTAAVAAVGTMGIAGAAPLPEGLLLVILYGLLWQRLFGATVVAERYLNERLVHAGEEDERADLHDRIERWHLTSMTVDLLRGAVTTVIAILAGVPLLRFAIEFMVLPGPVAAAAVAAAAAAVLLGAARSLADSRRSLLMLMAGLLCGSALLIIR